jgi:hypothetical protein
MPLERLGQCARGYPRVTLRLQAQALAPAVYELAHPDVSVCGVLQWLRAQRLVDMMLPSSGCVRLTLLLASCWWAHGETMR